MTEQALFFDCPNCDDPFAETKETEIDVHAGATYHCASCGGEVVFLALNVEQYTHPANLRWNCHFCKPEPCRFGPNTDATDDTQKGETT